MSSTKADDAAAAAAPSATPLPLDEDLLREYDAAERKFNALVADLKLPFLEVKLYQKYFVQTKTPERLAVLREVNALMIENRLQTLRLLKLIQERETVVSAVFNKAMEFSANRVTTLEVQTQVLQLQYKHQQVTLKIVEGIVAWRELLTHPYSFQWKGLDYLLKIADDCREIDGSSLRTVLPLRVSQFPLCSNITSISLFAEGAKGSSGSKKAAPDAAHSQQQQGTSPEMTRRLRAAEAIIFDERGVQERLLRHLQSVANTGSFVPLLNLQNFIPNCTSGIHVSKKEWDEQNRGAMERAVRTLQEDSQRRADRVANNSSQHRSKPATASSGGADSADDEGDSAPRARGAAADTAHHRHEEQRSTPRDRRSRSHSASSGSARSPNQSRSPTPDRSPSK